MAEYWKSQARKYCDFCKCWIADNKPSIEYHESGKKHKENVSKRLKEIHKNSAKQAKQQMKYENDIEKIEKAAMVAYLKDVESNTKDMMADKIIRKNQNQIKAGKKEQESYNLNRIPYTVSEAQSRLNESNSFQNYGAADIDPLDPHAKQKLARLSARKVKVNKKVEESDNKLYGYSKSEKEKSKNKISGIKPIIKRIWYEAQIQGHSYYWNIETNESVWEPPEEGFVSLTEQAEEVKEQAIQEKFLKEIDIEEKLERTEILEEQRANSEREKFKEIRTQFFENQKVKIENEKMKNMESQNESCGRVFNTPNKLQPYGSWKTIQTVEAQKIDLQLPQIKIPTTTINIEEMPLQQIFKEKTINHLFLGDGDNENSMIFFKKRKFGNKNVRKRTMDD